MAIKDKVKEDLDEIREEASDAMKMLHFTIQQTERKSRRDFVIIIVLIISLMCSIGYTFYIINNTEEITTTTSSVVDIDDVNNIDNSEIHN